MNVQPEQEFGSEASPMQSCVACQSPNLRHIYTNLNQPVDVGMLAETEPAARKATRGDLRLVQCQSCGLIYNAAFVPDLIQFQPGYDASLHHSGLRNDSLIATAKGLVARYDLNQKRIVEIGCGTGDLLKSICELANNRCVGIDPTLSVSAQIQFGKGRIDFIRGLFDESHRGDLGDLVIAISVIEDLWNPASFFSSLRNQIGDERTSLYLEFFNGSQALLHNSIWSPHYEQCNYFGLPSLSRILNSAGFDVVDSGPTFGSNDYLFVCAEPRQPLSPQGNGNSNLDLEDLDQLQTALDNQVAEWNTRLGEWNSKGLRMVLWGAGGKAATFLNSIPAARFIRHVVDVNPTRQGRFIAGSAQMVVAPRDLTDISPDIVIVSNPTYREEIRAMLRQLNVSCQLEVAS